jgi:hypothetical protein
LLNPSATHLAGGQIRKGLRLSQTGKVTELLAVRFFLLRLAYLANRGHLHLRPLVGKNGNQDAISCHHQTASPHLRFDVLAQWMSLQILPLVEACSCLFSESTHGTLTHLDMQENVQMFGSTSKGEEAS